MNKRKLLVLIILVIFCSGMIMGSASASHTYSKKGYRFTVSDGTYKKINYVKKHKYDSPDEMEGHKVYTKVKTNKKYSIKKPIYKNKKVTKTKWKYKKVLTSKSWYSGDTYHYKTYSTVNKYYNNGWKYDSYASRENSKGGYNDYDIVKKKVKYTTTKKVKTGKYKTVKKPIYALIETHRGGDPFSYHVTYDFYVNGKGYVKFGGEL